MSLIERSETETLREIGWLTLWPARRMIDVMGGDEMDLDGMVVVAAVVMVIWILSDFFGFSSGSGNSGGRGGGS